MFVSVRPITLFNRNKKMNSLESSQNIIESCQKFTYQNMEVLRVISALTALILSFFLRISRGLAAVIGGSLANSMADGLSSSQRLDRNGKSPLYTNFGVDEGDG
ncbi:unnamed protein product, partial [Nesidiocoris tenuis]